MTSPILPDIVGYQDSSLPGPVAGLSSCLADTVTVGMQLISSMWQLPQSSRQCLGSREIDNPLTRLEVFAAVTLQAVILQSSPL